MKLEEIMDTVSSFFENHVRPVHRITSVNEKDEYWEVRLEVIEEKEYMKRYGRDQLIGEYIAKLNDDLEVTSFERIGLRKRTSVKREDEEGR
ncbi:gas vesicle protein GvpR [Salipaludibacillus keqinensis]|uniref:Gas vesicle protein GvpR n=1 Tax=Salipaludibacillus keqinensis TaxID=2045207 RepID=A0A323TJB3_9BACI|nr:gas vesicle protein GvpO [Salipaludibacillus keqinensis]PYZ94630.1 gas vesicle protein GvpR [Salipaludibacillus keqinensis]